MKNLTLPLSLAAAAMLGACSSSPVHTTNTAGEIYTAPPGRTAQIGTGKVTDLVDPMGPVAGIATQRMTLLMQDGSYQVIDRRGPELAMGERVRVR
jgi:hypothetical protein